MQFDNESYEFLASREWLVTNGLGGYASGTLSGANTRRYHGLLAASFNPPTDRRILVSGIEEKIISNGIECFISSHQYPGTIYPDGFKYLKSFSAIPCPAFHFSANNFALIKSLRMVQGVNAIVIEYQNLSAHEIILQLKPLFVYRDHHHLMKNLGEYKYEVILSDETTVVVQLKHHAPPVYFTFSSGSFNTKSDWYYDFEYYHEKDRGLDYREDAITVGSLEVKLQSGEKLHLAFSDEDSFNNFLTIESKQHRTKTNSENPANDINLFISDLIKSGEQFIVRRESSQSHSIIAGYHWFTDWGRDTMIAMRGLVIANGKKEIAESIINTFLLYLKDGMIPNRFPDSGGEPEYNTIDATLWLFVVLYEYYHQFNDLEFIENNFASLTDIIRHHSEGTNFSIHVTEHGLLSGGAENTQLTWMDAKVGDHVVTPRHGCAVEINALWYNALNIYSAFAKLLKLESNDIDKRIHKTKLAFRKYFLNNEGYLNDVVIPEVYQDDSIRPNQIYALSLPFTPLNDKEAQQVLNVVTQHLHTDFGLRSLSPHHPDFKPVYNGDQWQRDHSYHQGTVWTFLWGEYALAYLKVNQYSDASKRHIIASSQSLMDHFYNNDGLHCMSEIFDGLNPREGKGCIHQAWSVGMTLKALLEAKSGNNTA